MVRPSRFVLLAMLVSMLAAVAAIDCRSKTFTDPDYLSERLQAGDEMAFRYIRRLEDPEARVTAIPALVDAYSAGIQPAAACSICRWLRAQTLCTPSSATGGALAPGAARGRYARRSAAR